MRVLVLTIVTVVLLAGCMGWPDTATPPSGVTPTPGASPPATPTTPGSPTPAATPPGMPGPGGGFWEGTVDVTIGADPTTARAGEEIRLTLVAKNQREWSFWTNPAFACDGSWDVRIADAQGNVLRVDDRDAMGCPTTDTYATEIPPGEEITATYTWDGMLRPSLGQSEPAPPGRYTATGVVRYATEEGQGNGSRGTAAEARATTTVEIT